MNCLLFGDSYVLVAFIFMTDFLRWFLFYIGVDIRIGNVGKPNILVPFRAFLTCNFGRSDDVIKHNYFLNIVNVIF